VQLRNIISRMRGKSQTVGLDIGHRLIKVAVVGHKKQSSSGVLLALGQEPLPEGIIVDNEIKNLAVLTDKIQSLLFRVMPGGVDGDFIASVNWTSGILCDRILVKPLPKKARIPEKRHILDTAMARSPFDDGNNVLDCSIIERREEGTEAMIVAAKKDVLEKWVDLFKSLGIKLMAIDVDIFALTNAYYLSSASEQDDDDSILLLNLGFNKAYLASLRDGRFNTARSIMGCSIQELQEQLMNSLKISNEQASDLLMGNEVKDTNVAEARLKSAKEFTFDEIHTKIDTAIRYFSSSDNYRIATKMIIVGGSTIDGLVPYLAQKLSLEVTQLNPFKTVQIKTSRFQGKDLTAMSSAYSIALGLALRKF